MIKISQSPMNNNSKVAEFTFQSLNQRADPWNQILRLMPMLEKCILFILSTCKAPQRIDRLLTCMFIMSAVDDGYNSQ